MNCPESPRTYLVFVSRQRRINMFMSVGTSGVVYPAAGLVRLAKAVGAYCIEVNPVPSGTAAFDEVIRAGSEAALPRLIGRWLNEDPTSLNPPYSD